MPGEELVMKFRQHWVYMIWPLVIFVGATGLFLFLGFIILEVEQEIVKMILMTAALVMYFTLLHWFFVSLYFWLFSMTYITNRRVIMFETLPFVHTDESFISVAEIHEVEEHQQGFWQNILSYGTLVINLPAVPLPIHLHFVPRPTKVASVIDQLRYETMKEREKTA